MEPPSIQSRKCQDNCELVLCLARPFSITLPLYKNKDPFQKPQVTVNYFSVDVDLDIQVGGARLGRKLLSTTPLR
jgi:hypothetical protein